MHKSQLNQIIDSLIMKIAHDLINPIGAIQMAFEENETEYLTQSIQEALLKVDMLRFIYRPSTEDALQKQKFEDYIQKKTKNIVINFNHIKITPLLFVLSEKMLTKSTLVVNQEEILLTDFFLNDQEIEGLNGNFAQINSSNILLYLACSQYKTYYKTKLEYKENNEWRIQILNI